MIHQQVNSALIPVNVERNLPFHKREACSKFQQKICNLSCQLVFKVAFLFYRCHVNKSKIIWILERSLG